VGALQCNLGSVKLDQALCDDQAQPRSGHLAYFAVDRPEVFDEELSLVLC